MIKPIENILSKQVNKIINLIDEKSKEQLYISSLTGSFKSLFLSKLIEKEKQIFILLPEIKLVEEIFVELSILGLSEKLIPVSEFKSVSLQEKLTEINKKENFILISSYNILNCELPPKEKLEQQTTKINLESGIKFDELIEYLNLLDYQKDKFVGAPGEYSQRGSIIDFWSFSEPNPVRLEFDGDFIESMRYFEPDSQRSIQFAETISLAAAIENQNNSENNSTIFDYLNNPLILASSFELKNLKSKNINLFNKEAEKTQPEIVQDVKFDEDEFPEVQESFEPEEIKRDLINLDNLFATSNGRWLIEESFGIEKIDLGFSEPPSINGNFEILFNVLKEYSENDFKIIITSENEFQTTRLYDLLIDFKKEVAELIESGKVRLFTLPIKSGFLHREEKILVLTDYQIFNKPYRTKISSKQKKKKSKSKEFASIHKGDFVVHENYGIGKYTGLETIKIGEVEQESMKILYNEGGIVYVNLNYLNYVKKYSSSETITPTLNTLGTPDWTNTKAKAKRKIKEAARELIELYAKRKASKGFSFSNDTVWQKELEASFFYEDTPDQVKVTEEVKNDMEADNPMDRLICGDVGFGKTEVAVRAAFKAAQDGKQTAVLVPTTILAEQHYNTFKDRLTQFPVRIAALSRFQTKKEQTEILKELNEGRMDVVVGTHRLLSKDVQFKDLGLLIIDEEHRFGVASKEKLRAFKVNVDTLSLTATPIPRTLNLSLLGARDLSIIATPPPNRQPIYTTVSTFDIFKIKEWILNEIKRNGQIYFVHDRVQSIDKLGSYIKKYIPDLRLAVAHGQMKPSQLEEVIHGFLNRKFDVLLSTKIIESGIDIPNVNTIIVNRADRFGLAELHQLRGRVGRSNRQAYAYFIVPSMNGITKKALRRLQVIEEFTEIGSGFNISMRDLEIRGAGNLLGTEQTGFINDVGFDLYIKLINEAVEELKFSEFKDVFKELPKHEDRTNPTIDSYFEVGIPQTFMPEQADRLNFYTALYSVTSLEEIDDLKEEMIDRFGSLPEIVKRLIGLATLKFFASHALFERVIIQKKNIFLILPKGENEDYYKTKFNLLMRFIMDEYKNKIKFNQQKEVLKLVIVNDFKSPEELLEY
ncbi:MAG TPA: transcription-repair coupling factor, partial [Ignavibacteriaceae bacterium]|nr:transcription-repair coupling factor [Ignavibacteriaceae bacterium]